MYDHLHAAGRSPPATVSSADAPVPRRPPPLTPTRLVAALWALLASAGVLQLVAREAAGATDAAHVLLLQDVALLALWALATPALVWSAGRFPLTSRPCRHGLLHLTAAALFIVAGNLLIRVPLTQPPWSRDAAWVTADTFLGVVRFGPAALLVYATIVTAAHFAWRQVARAPHRRDAGRSTSSPHGEVPGVAPDQIAVREWSRVHHVRPDDIDWVEADDNNVVVCTNTRIYKGRGRIGDFESQLDPRRFIRIHRSAIVRVAAVREVQPLAKGDLAVVLADSKVLRVARARRKALEHVLEIVANSSSAR